MLITYYKTKHETFEAIVTDISGNEICRTEAWSLGGVKTQIINIIRRIKNV